MKKYVFLILLILFQGVYAIEVENPYIDPTNPSFNDISLQNGETIRNNVNGRIAFGLDGTTNYANIIAKDIKSTGGFFVGSSTNIGDGTSKFTADYNGNIRSTGNITIAGIVSGLKISMSGAQSAIGNIKLSDSSNNETIDGNASGFELKWSHPNFYIRPTNDGGNLYVSTWTVSGITFPVGNSITMSTCAVTGTFKMPASAIAVPSTNVATLTNCPATTLLTTPTWVTIIVGTVTYVTPMFAITP